MHSHHDFAHDFAAAIFGRALPGGMTTRDPDETKRRFAVYRNNVLHGLTMSLAQRFPTVERLVGADFFAATARAFAAEHPPRSPILVQWGEEFPGFLSRFPPAQSLFYLPDIALIDWARGQAYHAADADPVAPETLLAATAPGADLRLGLHPSVHLLSFDIPAARLWASQQTGGPAAPDPAHWTPESALIARVGLAKVPVIPVSASQAAFLERLIAGEQLSKAIAGAPDGFDLGETLALLIRHGLFTSLTKEP